MKFFLVVVLFLTVSFARADEVLLIGDSHTVGAFGQALAKAIGAKRYAVGGTGASAWAQKTICGRRKTCPYRFGYATPKTPTFANGAPPANFPGLDGLLEEVRPSIVVIALGTNDVMQSDCKSGPAIRKMILLRNMIGRAKCVWVGPPYYSKGPVVSAKACGDKNTYQKFVMNMKSALSEACTFIDSQEIFRENGQPIEADAGDQLHFSQRLGTFWGNKVAERLK